MEQAAEPHEDSGSNQDLIIRLPTPPEDEFWPRLDDAKKAIHDFTESHGYAITSKRTHYDKKGEKNGFYYRCDRGGKYSSTIDESLRRRETQTRRIDCPFDAVLAYSHLHSAWKLRVRNPDHNHEPTERSALPSARKRYLDSKKVQVDRQSSMGH